MLVGRSQQSNTFSSAWKTAIDCAKKRFQQHKCKSHGHSKDLCALISTTHTSSHELHGRAAIEDEQALVFDFDLEVWITGPLDDRVTLADGYEERWLCILHLDVGSASIRRIVNGSDIVVVLGTDTCENFQTGPCLHRGAPGKSRLCSH